MDFFDVYVELYDNSDLGCLSCGVRGIGGAALETHRFSLYKAMPKGAVICECLTVYTHASSCISGVGASKSWIAC